MPTIRERDSDRAAPDVALVSRNASVIGIGIRAEVGQRRGGGKCAVLRFVPLCCATREQVRVDIEMKQTHALKFISIICCLCCCCCCVSEMEN